MKKLVLKNYFFFGNPDVGVESLTVWLQKQMLHGKASRARTRFVKMISERAKEIEEQRQEMLIKYAEKKKKKNKEGKKIEMPILYTKDDKETTNQQEGVRYKLKDVKGYNKELLEYLQEDYVIDVTPATSDTIYEVRDIVLNTKAEFSGVMASRYDEWCEAFENIKKST